jgi:hypothetical protein
VDLDVPTMLEMNRLERAETEQPTPRAVSAWGTRQALVLLGVTVILVGFGMGGWFYYTLRPLPYDRIDYHPLVALSLWESLRKGVDAPPYNFEISYERMTYRYHQWMVFAAVVSLVGILIVGASLLVDPLGRSRQGGGP